MSVKAMPVPTTLGRAACADHLELVDAAHARPGGPEAQDMKRLCRACPVSAACLEWAMVNIECGIWGGISPAVRTKHGAPSGRHPRVVKA